MKPDSSSFEDELDWSSSAGNEGDEPWSTPLSTLSSTEASSDCPDQFLVPGDGRDGELGSAFCVVSVASSEGERSRVRIVGSVGVDLDCKPPSTGFPLL